MASLKDLRSQISSVRSTRRITSAMKMVAASKLRRAEEAVARARPYAGGMDRMLSSLAESARSSAGAPALLRGTGSDQKHLLVLVSSNRGLCGGFNVNIVRWARTRIEELEKEGKSVKLFMIGSKAGSAMRREFGQYMVAENEEALNPSPSYEGATQIGSQLVEMFEAGEFDVCTVVYNRFISVLTQIVTPHQLVPFAPNDEDKEKEKEKEEASTALPLVYDFEASEEEILQEILPRNLYVQILTAMLESFASEQGARMTAMDNATRNANDLIEDLTKVYNRTRQAMITKELIEIISGSEAL